MIAAREGRIRPPDFLIIGTERGGTTSLYTYLLTENSKVISPALRKEIHFFDQNYYKGWTWYLSHFPARGGGILSGEASPHYYFFPEAGQRIGEDLPGAKLIILLRNPIERAYSHYQHEFALGYEHLSFKEAIGREVEVTDDVWKPKSLRVNGTSQYVHFSYLSKGLYAQHLQSWFEKIPRERFLILKSESFFDNPGETLSRVLHFLGLPSSNPFAFKKYNEGRYEPLDSGMRSRLAKFYEPYNDKLSELLGMDFHDWA